MKQQLELDMEQQTGSKTGKEYVKAAYCHPDYLTYMQSTSWKQGLWVWSPVGELGSYVLHGRYTKTRSNIVTNSMKILENIYILKI